VSATEAACAVCIARQNRIIAVSASNATYLLSLRYSVTVVSSLLSPFTVLSTLISALRVFDNLESRAAGASALP